MSKESVFTMKLEPELRAAFMAEAEASHRPASQIMRELMRDFVKRQRESREYDEFLRGKVADAREQVRTGDYLSATDIEARFAERRAQLQASLGSGSNIE
jgi:predicted transcriptional regulator